MTNDKLERVARAILDEMDITDGLDAESAERYAAAAIAACEAEAGEREPTDAMIEAGVWAMGQFGNGDSLQDKTAAIYTAMRHAALNTTAATISSAEMRDRLLKGLQRNTTAGEG